MSHLALIPTHHLPGWPEVYEPTLLDNLLYTVIIPVAMAAVFTLFFMGPHWLRKSQSKAVERA